MARYRAELVPGSYLALTHITRDYASPQLNQALDHAVQSTPDEFYPRDLRRVTSLFKGFELVSPGVVGCAGWRPEAPGDFSDEPGSNATIYAGVGRVP